MSANNRQQLLTFVAIGAIGLWVADTLVREPLMKSWKARSSRILELRRSVARGEQVLEREQAVRSRWSGMKTNTLVSERSSAQSEVLKTFDQWAQESRINVNSIKPQWKRNADDYMTLECRVDAYGSMSGLVQFLHHIEKDHLALRVESVEIGTRDTTGQQLSLGLLVSGLRLGESEEGAR